MLDWSSMIPLFYPPIFLNCNVKMILQVPEKGTNRPVSVRNSIEIEWTVFERTVFFVVQIRRNYSVFWFKRADATVFQSFFLINDS